MARYLRLLPGHAFHRSHGYADGDAITAGLLQGWAYYDSLPDMIRDKINKDRLLPYEETRAALNYVLAEDAETSMDHMLHVAAVAGTKWRGGGKALMTLSHGRARGPGSLARSERDA